jgi:hypothetical protein
MEQMLVALSVKIGKIFLPSLKEKKLKVGHISEKLQRITFI